MIDINFLSCTHTSFSSFFCKILSGITVIVLIGSNLLNLTPSETFAASSVFGTTGNNPVGITVDESGNIYTANYFGNSVTKITPDGTSTIAWATTGDFPEGITIDGSGNIYTANYFGNSVTKITPEGVSTYLGGAGNNPVGITIDGSGNIYTANAGSDSVTKITPEGVSSTLGTTGHGPNAIVIDGSGNVYTSNGNSNDVTKITPEGVSSTLGTTGAYPRGITVDKSGNIYTVNWDDLNVSKITPEGVSSIFGTTEGNAQGITIDASGNIYVAVTNGGNVIKITPEGVSSIFGSAGSVPEGITIDGSGNVYTANAGDNTVTKIDTSSNDLSLTETLTTTGRIHMGDTVNYKFTVSNLSETGHTYGGNGSDFFTYVLMPDLVDIGESVFSGGSEYFLSGKIDTPKIVCINYSGIETYVPIYEASISPYPNTNFMLCLPTDSIYIPAGGSFTWNLATKALSDFYDGLSSHAAFLGGQIGNDPDTNILNNALQNSQNIFSFMTNNNATSVYHAFVPLTIISSGGENGTGPGGPVPGTASWVCSKDPLILHIFTEYIGRLGMKFCGYMGG